MASFISPYAADRELARKAHEAGGLAFYEVWVNTPVEECEARDPKGLYKKARAGEIKGFTGIDAPYEAPEDAALVLTTKDATIEQCVQQVLDFLVEKGFLRAAQ